MSDVIVLPPSGNLLICQCVTQGSQKKEKKGNKLSVLFKKANKHESQHSSILLSINFTFTGI